MVHYILRRFLYMIVSLFLVSIVAFIVIQLPPGDYVDTLVLQMEQQTNSKLADEQIASLKRQFGLDVPMLPRYFRWIGNIIIRGDYGRSFSYGKPVIDLLAERIPLTATISLLTIILTYIVAIPIGIYSAVRQYSVFDYFSSSLGFLGLAIPNFVLALVLMFLAYKYLGISIGGLFSPDFRLAPWSLARIWDLLKHLPIPLIVVGTAGTAGLIRVVRASLLDELKKQYVITARAKGVAEKRLVFRYPVRIAMNPVVSTIGWLLPAVVSGETITAIVLNLPTTGPMLLKALLFQDTYLAGSTVLFLAALTVLGTFVSDMLLMVVDPRIRLDRNA